MKSNNDLHIIQKKIFEVSGFKYTPAKMDDEGTDYNACSFSLEGRSIKYRQAKITPTKNGQFVTIWKRKSKRPIQPYDSSDEIDFVLVTVRDKNDLGLFVFPKESLIKHGVFSLKNKGGKRAIRVYPSWDVTQSKQAEKTQKWQLDYFLHISKSKSLNVTKCKSLFLGK